MRYFLWPAVLGAVPYFSHRGKMLRAARRLQWAGTLTTVYDAIIFFDAFIFFFLFLLFF